MGPARLAGVVLPHTSLSFQKASSAVTEGYTEGTWWFSRDLAPGDSKTYPEHFFKATAFVMTNRKNNREKSKTRVSKSCTGGSHQFAAPQRTVGRKGTQSREIPKSYCKICKASGMGSQGTERCRQERIIMKDHHFLA